MVTGENGHRGARALNVKERVDQHERVSAITHLPLTAVNRAQPISTMTFNHKPAMMELRYAYLIPTVCLTFNRAKDGILENGHFDLEKHQVEALVQP